MNRIRLVPYISLQTTLLPTAAWGTQFPVIPFANVDNQQYQIVANTDGTIINLNDDSVHLDAGQYQILNIGGAIMLTSNYPIQLVEMGKVCVRQHCKFDGW